MAQDGGDGVGVEAPGVEHDAGHGHDEASRTWQDILGYLAICTSHVTKQYSVKLLDEQQSENK